MTSTAVTLTSLLGDITSIITQGISWIGSVITAITSNPLLLMFVLFGFIGTGIGLVKRIMRV